MLGQAQCGKGGFTVEGAHRFAAIMMGSMAASLFVYAIIVEVLRRQGIGGSLSAAIPESGVIRFAFFAIALGLIPVAGMLRGRMLQKSSGDSVEMLVVRLVRSTIVTAGLCEVPAIFGLVLFVIGGAVADFYILLAASIGMFMLYFPRLERWHYFVRSARHTTPEPPAATR